MKSMVKETKKFHIPDLPLRVFSNIGVNHGEVHIIFLCKKPISAVHIDKFTIVNSLCKYAHVYNETTLCGLLLCAKKDNTHIDDYKVSILSHEPCDFKVSSVFENMGIYLIKGKDSSLIFLSNPKSTLLVEVDLL